MHQFQKPTNSQSHYEEIVYTEFHPNWSTNVESTGRTSLTPSNKLIEPIFTNHACQITYRTKLLYGISLYSPTNGLVGDKVHGYAGTVST